MNIAKYILGVIALLAAIILFSCLHTILPFVNDGEYWIQTINLGEDLPDGYNKMYRIHRYKCDMSDEPWFCEKRPLWDLLINKDAELCDLCFIGYDAEKAFFIHNKNKEELDKMYKHHYPDSIRLNKMSQYK